MLQNSTTYYFHSTKTFIQLQQKYLFNFNKNNFIREKYLFNFNKNNFIQQKYLFNFNKNNFIQQKYLFNFNKNNFIQDSFFLPAAVSPVMRRMHLCPLGEGISRLLPNGCLGRLSYVCRWLKFSSRGLSGCLNMEFSIPSNLLGDLYFLEKSVKKSFTQ